MFKTKKECNNYIKENESKEYHLSGISYDEVTETYLVFMNHSPTETTLSKWFDGCQNAERNVISSAVGWIESHHAKDKFFPYLVFKDAPSGEILICLTDRDLGLSSIEIVLDGKIVP